LDKAADQIIVDTQGLDLNEYERDLSECDALAQQIDISKRTRDRAIGGVVVGSVVGAILGDSDSAQKNRRNCRCGWWRKGERSSSKGATKSN